MAPAGLDRSPRPVAYLSSSPRSVATISGVCAAVTRDPTPLAVRPVSLAAPPLVVIHQPRRGVSRLRFQLKVHSLAVANTTGYAQGDILQDHAPGPDIQQRPILGACAVGKLQKKMAKMDTSTGDGNSLYPIAVLIDELRNDDVQVWKPSGVRFAPK